MLKWIDVVAVGLVMVMGAGCHSPGSSGPSTGMQNYKALANFHGQESGEDWMELRPAQNTEEYDRVFENPFLEALDNPLSTFSVDVDTASYSNVRRFLQTQLPPKDAVRIEEMVNYFDYRYPQPGPGETFRIVTEVAEAPWNRKNRLVRIGLQGRQVDLEDLRPSNLVFLVDTSGSMQAPNKLPLVKQSLRILLEHLDDQDRVSIVTYAGSAGLALPSTPVSQHKKIDQAIDRMEAQGSTAGGAGLELAYRIASENFIHRGNNRVVLMTDGDFNVGISSTGDLVRLIEEKRKGGVYLTICGFGMGNYKDGRLEQISNLGNGNYYYIDREEEARKVFGQEMRATLFTLAKDVKVQVEFNPALVRSYRLLGYENRRLETQDFEDDLKDSGEVGAGHSVTALYEVVPVRIWDESSRDLKYQTVEVKSGAYDTGELGTVRLRYKSLDSDRSQEMERAVLDDRGRWEKASDDFRFAAAVAGFGMLLQGSAYSGNCKYDDVIEWGRGALGKDSNEDRAEMIRLVRVAKEFSKNLAQE